MRTSSIANPSASSTSAAPWVLVEGEDKPYARVKVLRSVCDALERKLVADNCSQHPAWYNDSGKYKSALLSLFSDAEMARTAVLDSSSLLSRILARQGEADDLKEGTGVEIGLWAVGLGAPFGTMTYAAPVDGLAGSAAMNAKLIDHAGYHAAVAKLREHTTGPAETNMMRAMKIRP